MTRRNAILAMIIAAPLAGCFEVSAEAQFQQDGTAVVTAEIGVAAELIALAANAPANGSSPADLITNCGDIARKSEERKGVRSISAKMGQRNGLVTCTLRIELSDPVAALQDVAAQGNGPPFTIERDGQYAYGIKGRFQSGMLPGPPGPSAQEAQMQRGIAVAMLAGRYLTVSLHGLRVETGNGELQEGGKKAVWKIPLVALMNPQIAAAQAIDAKVTYNETWMEKALRWIGVQR